MSFSSPRPFAILRLKSPVWPTILPIKGGRIVEFSLFPEVLALCEMQSAVSWVWTCVAMSIFHSSNHCSMNTSYFSLCLYIYIYIYIYMYLCSCMYRLQEVYINSRYTVIIFQEINRKGRRQNAGAVGNAK